VFGITWSDVDRWGKRADESTWLPYGGLAQQAARAYYRQTVPYREPNELERYVWTNPIDLLLHVLAEPDPGLWCRRAEAALAGMLHQATEKTTADSGGIGERIAAAVRGEPLPSPKPGKIVLARGVDANDCPVTVVIDGRHPQRVLSALTVVDD